MIELNSKTIDDLLPMDKVHWGLHLRATMKDTPSVKKEVMEFLKGAVLPDLKHPFEIHDWLEKPEMRTVLKVQ